MLMYHVANCHSIRFLEKYRFMLITPDMNTLSFNQSVRSLDSSSLCCVVYFVVGRMLCSRWLRVTGKSVVLTVRPHDSNGTCMYKVAQLASKARPATFRINIFTCVYLFRISCIFHRLAPTILSILANRRGNPTKRLIECYVEKQR